MNRYLRFVNRRRESDFWTERTVCGISGALGSMTIVNAWVKTDLLDMHPNTSATYVIFKTGAPACAFGGALGIVFAPCVYTLPFLIVPVACLWLHNWSEISKQRQALRICCEKKLT